MGLCEGVFCCFFDHKLNKISIKSDVTVTFSDLCFAITEL